MADLYSSAIFYNSFEDQLSQPFFQIRQDKIQEMFEQGKCELLSTIPQPGFNPARRNWATAEAAQEFVDFVVQTAPIYNIPIVRTDVIDLTPYL